MSDRGGPFLDIPDPLAEPPPVSARLFWGAMAGVVALAGLAVAVAVWQLLPPSGAVPAPIAAAPGFHASAPPTAPPNARDGGEAELPPDPALVGLVGGLPEGWRAGVPVVFGVAVPWTLPDLPLPEAAPSAPLSPEAMPDATVGLQAAPAPTGPEAAPDASAEVLSGPMLPPPEAVPDPLIEVRAVPMPPAPEAAPAPSAEAPAVMASPPRPAATPGAAAERRRPAAPVARPANPQPAPVSANAARCRASVLAALVGEQVPAADLALMRAGCGG